MALQWEGVEVIELIDRNLTYRPRGFLLISEVVKVTVVGIGCQSPGMRRKVLAQLQLGLGIRPFDLLGAAIEDIRLL